MINDAIKQQKEHIMLNWHKFLCACAYINVRMHTHTQSGGRNISILSRENTTITFYYMLLSWNGNFSQVLNGQIMPITELERKS